MSFHTKPNMYSSHVQLKVSNLANSIAFYTNVLGFQVLEQIGQTVYFTTDGKTSLVSLVEVSNAQPLKQGQTGLYHFALLLPEKKDLGNFVQHLVALNVRIGAGDHHVSEALYLNDPDGNGIEVYIDRPAAQWVWENEHVYMTTEQVNFQGLLAAADGNWTGLPSGTVMGHVHLSVADLAKTEQFYTHVLDYQVVTRYGAQALFISTGKYHHHFGLNTWGSANGSPVPENGVGLQSVTVVLNDEAYASQVKEALQNAGYAIDAVDNAPIYGGTQQFSVVDPNGIRLIFTTEGH